MWAMGKVRYTCTQDPLASKGTARTTTARSGSEGACWAPRALNPQTTSAFKIKTNQSQHHLEKHGVDSASEIGTWSCTPEQIQNKIEKEMGTLSSTRSWWGLWPMGGDTSSTSGAQCLMDLASASPPAHACWTKQLLIDFCGIRTWLLPYGMRKWMRKHAKEETN